MYAWIHTIRLWLWRRQVRMMERDCRPSGTSDGDWIGANVAASAASSGAGAGSQAGMHHGFTACESGGISYTDTGSCGSAGGDAGGSY
ncbi:hypothetical protein Q8W71_28385 [Methylobacterium sp. NEAU 140]|uniref:hypothetical protein n=1 Tax=Methylobacterium sp. NEAU 140 TaxID=3064945 RepID=UPI00273507CB|nr:hypothetical protein [Methylobacterium sp. NEAU 140]MDP4026539.1 hypothetical protein [Methylobacterium sp. NEAU 140]